MVPRDQRSYYTIYYAYMLVLDMALELTKVLISDSIDASCREILQNNNVPVDYKPGISKEELLAIIKV